MSDRRNHPSTVCGGTDPSDVIRVRSVKIPRRSIFTLSGDGSAMGTVGSLAGSTPPGGHGGD